MIALAQFFNSPTVDRLLDKINFPTDLRTIRAQLHIPDMVAPMGLAEGCGIAGRLTSEPRKSA